MAKKQTKNLNSLVVGKTYSIISNGQFVEAILLKEEKTIFGTRYAFVVKVRHRNINGHVIYTSSEVRFVGKKDIIS